MRFHQRTARCWLDPWRRTPLRVAAGLAVWLALSLLAGPVWSQGNTAGGDLEAKLNRPGSIVLREATLSDWMLAIQQEWNINIVGGGELQRETVSGAFTDTTLREVLSAILYNRGYGFQPAGNSLQIMKLDDIGPIKPGAEAVLIRLESLTPTDAEPYVRLFLSRTGTVQSVPRTKTLTVIDFPQNIATIRDKLRDLETEARQEALREKQQADDEQRTVRRPGTGRDAANTPASGQSANADDTAQAKSQIVEVFQPQFVKAETLAEMVTSVLGDDGQARSLRDENRLVIQASPNAMRLAAEVIQRVDLPRAQVRITALLYDVNLEVMEQFGINWQHSASGGGSTFGFDANTIKQLTSAAEATAEAAADGAEAAATAASPAAMGGLLTLKYVKGNLDINNFISLLDQTDGARLLARPTVMAYDRTQAEIKIVSEIPVQQLTETSQGGAIGTTEFREAGITLSVTPEVLKDNTVLLEVAPEFSVLAGYSSGGQPIIDKRSTNTKVQVLDGQTLVLGGLLRRSEMETVRGIPGLMHWKYLGRLFQAHETTVTDSELLVFIKTEIVQLTYQPPPREQMALQVSDDMLERTPYAGYEPLLPPCRDPHCPYHCPDSPYRQPGYNKRCGIIGHCNLLPDCSSPAACDTCPTDPYLKAAPMDPTYAAPAIESYDPSALPLPTPAEPGPGRQLDSPTGVELPPPVIIEEAARRAASPAAQVALRRLPRVKEHPFPLPDPRAVIATEPVGTVRR